MVSNLVCPFVPSSICNLTQHNLMCYIVWWFDIKCIWYWITFSYISHFVVPEGPQWDFYLWDFLPFFPLTKFKNTVSRNYVPTDRNLLWKAHSVVKDVASACLRADIFYSMHLGEKNNKDISFCFRSCGHPLSLCESECRQNRSSSTVWLNRRLKLPFTHF